jgi:glycosyltransferase involved in cell wall biosynthesis
LAVFEQKTRFKAVIPNGLKIQFDDQIFRLQKYGGISRYLVRIAEEFQMMGHQPQILGGIHINAYLRDLDPKIGKGLYIDHYPKRTIRLLRDSGRMVNQLRHDRGKPDVIHETYFSTQPVLRGTQPRVISEYDCMFELFPELFSHLEIVSQQKKAAFERADLILSISHHTKADLMRIFSIPEEKIKVTHLAADPAIPDHEIILPNSGGRPFLLYVGIRSKHKNFERLVRAFADSPRLMKEMDLVVFTPFAFSQSELSLFKDLGFGADQVRRESGHDRRLFGFFKTAQAFIYPSKYEGFGIPPLEAMTYGCPVASSNTSSLPEVVGDAALTFDPENQEEMTVKLELIAFDDALRQELIRKGFERITLFSWRKTAEETIGHYQSLM